MRLGQGSGDSAGEDGKRRIPRHETEGGADPGTPPSSGVPAGQAQEAGPPGEGGRARDAGAPGPAQASGPAQGHDPAQTSGPVQAAHGPAQDGGPGAADGAGGGAGGGAGQTGNAVPPPAEGGGAPAAPPPSGHAPGKQLRFAKPLTTASLIGWTGLSVLLPGAAHLRAGRRRTGYALIGAFGVLLVAAVVAAFVISENTGFLARDNTLLAGAILSGVGAVAWFLLVLSSYISLRPKRLTGRGQIVSGVAIGVLCVAVMSPFALAASAVLTVKDAANTIFESSAGNPTVVPVKHDDPWNGRERVNFLLVGGDGAGNREGIRTDSMTVASVHVATGNTVMFSLPRNLQHVRFPPDTALGRQFPNGFMRELPNGGLLNEVWQYGEEHPEVVQGKDGQRGPKALMEAIGYTLNLKIDYYALINMFGFAHLVDAIGGLKIRVEKDVPWGGLYGTAGTIKAGYRTLSGEEALWYGRSRVGSDDFSRMSRQRCVIGAFAQQATPSVVLTNFVKIANVAKRMAKTDIPRELLDPLTGLALKVKNARITSLQFVPPEFYSGSPDWQKIRAATAKALRQSAQPARRAQAAGVTASPDTSGATPTPSATGTVRAMPHQTPHQTPSQTPTRNGGGAKSLGELCGF
ncbi:LCP family protein [Streptosporangium sp. NPDC051023]|uniref:LCP family protein n=1 Tax=Streptosporangium sp. NPDC051023 TaxID=3155410 RepID=UPI00344EB361